MTIPEVNQILEDDKRSLIEIYLDIQMKMEGKYGQNTVVIMEVGSFFEVYGVDNDEEKIGKSKEIADILNIQLTRKNKSIAKNSTKNPLLAGFPVATFDRYVNRLVQEKKYTLVIIKQKGIPPQITRYLDRIISPGVNFDYALSQDNNYFASIIIDKNDGIYSAGLSLVDVTTGKTISTEAYGSSEDRTSALDNIFNQIQSHNISEYILSFLSEDVVMDEMVKYLEIKSTTDVKMIENHPSIQIQNEILGKTYGVKSMLTPIEYLDLERKPLAAESLTLLLQYIVEHDFRLIEKMAKPEIIESDKYLYLGNNPLEQLNFKSKDKDEVTAAKLFNLTSTCLGKRLFFERLYNPIIDKQELEHRYQLSDRLKNNYLEIDNHLKKVYDLERIKRKISLSKLHPFEVNYLYDSLTSSVEIIKTILGQKKDLLTDFVALEPRIKDFIKSLCNTFQLDETVRRAFHGIDRSFFQEGINEKLDQLVQTNIKLSKQLESIRQRIADLLHDATEREGDEFVKVKQLDKEGHYINLTKNRYQLIKDELMKSSVEIGKSNYQFRDFNIKVQTNNVKITATIIDEISEKIIINQTKIIALVKEIYQEKLEYIDQEYALLLEQIILFIAKIDVAISNVKATKKFNLARPQIVDGQGDSGYLELIGLRHPLVEAQEESGIYVPNDIIIGSKTLMGERENILQQSADEDVKGVMLYGINSSGKSSLMKSIGIAVVLAQSGMYVPCKEMRFVIFKKLFTRIIARDNYIKGLSSFAVEMMELKNIFNRCCLHSLVLGDEISHSTETMSAIAIVSATIWKISQCGSLFLFATHLHQLNMMADISDNKKVVCVHLQVDYDQEKKKIIFKRVLAAGSGQDIYGLEFAQSLDIDKQFIDKAITIRKKLTDEFDSLEILAQNKKCKYNTNLIATHCLVCEKKCDDIHHLVEQYKADRDGNIKHFHKDHKYNLLPLCKECHSQVHAGKLRIKGFVMTSKGLELDYERA